jgi:RHS repeat-associated protein
LELLTQYFQNQVFYTQDAYGRREYMGYRASDGELIRRVQTTHPSYTLANNTAIMNLTRTTTPNAAYVIADAIKNAAGELTQVLDGRGTSTTYDYDSRGQQIRQRAAQGTALEAVTEWTYDVAGNTLEVRTPRYFDATDPAYQQAKSTTTYNGRNQVVTSTEAPGTPVAATTQTSYYADGRVDTTTDARGNAWKSVWYSCCGNSVGQRDPAGHGSLSNSDPMGHAAHTAVVQDFDMHTTVQDPLDAKTLAESTTKFDVLGRPVASTQWLTARGLVDPQSVPLAGLYAADKTEGLTTQTLYDRNLTDGVGLDSATGMTVSKLGGGTYNVSLAAVLTKLASTPANGGASVTFATGSDGSATVSISPLEELTVSVQDGLGRTVCTAQIQSYSGSSPNALVSWQCTQYDSVVSLSGFGNVLETVHIDAANGQAKSRTDGAGRTLQTLDALGQATTLKYDAGGAVVERRDANNVGYNAVFDALGRETSRTDTQGAVVQTSYNRAGDVKTVTDAKSQVTTSVYDARGRLVSRTNRLSGGTAWTYDANGNLLTLTDAENQTTAYAYDSRNLKTQETYPDHVAGATVGTAGYGIVEFSYDPARRVQRKTDQLGDTVTYQFDLAGRLTRRDYRTRVNSPSGTIADSDLFTFDLASRLLTAVSGRYANTVTQTYDGVGRLKTESLTVAGQTYPVTRDYDVLGRLSRLTYPDGSLVDRTYTARSQLYQVKHNNSLLETRAYDNGGRWTSQTYGNGVVTTRTYRNDNLTTLIDVRDGSNAQLDSFAYTYDANQNKTAETRTGVMAPWGWSTGTSGYDAEDRLRAWNRTDGQLTQGWNLTLEGDWQQFTQNGTPQNRTHGLAHELTAVGGTGLTHDVKGNLTQAATGHRYTWDFDNQLQGVDTSGDQVADVTFGYDALGRRVKKTASGATKIYVSATQPIAYSPQAGQELAEYVSGAVPTSPTEKYVYGDYIDEPIWKTGTGGAVYYHANALYCVSALTNGSGAVVERYRYTPYGELTILAADGTTVRSASTYANPYTYTGRRWDSETGLYFYRARYYHPALGRFIRRDPIRYADSRQTYQYVSDDPISQADASGLFQTRVFGSLTQTLCGGLALEFEHDLQIDTGEEVLVVQKICAPKAVYVERCRVEGGLSTECGCGVYDSCEWEMAEESCHYEWFAKEGEKRWDEQTRYPYSSPNGCSSQGHRYDTISIRVFPLTDEVRKERAEKFRDPILVVLAGCDFSHAVESKTNPTAFSKERPRFWDTVTPIAKNEVEIYIQWHCCFTDKAQQTTITSAGQVIFNK